MFYGLIVSMYYLDTKQHKLPDIHVKYSGMEAVYQIPGGKLLEGSLSSNKDKLCRHGIEIHPGRLKGKLAISHNS